MGLKCVQQIAEIEGNWVPCNYKYQEKIPINHSAKTIDSGFHLRQLGKLFDVIVSNQNQIENLKLNLSAEISKIKENWKPEIAEAISPINTKLSEVEASHKRRSEETFESINDMKLNVQQLKSVETNFENLEKKVEQNVEKKLEAKLKDMSNFEARILEKLDNVML